GVPVRAGREVQGVREPRRVAQPARRRPSVQAALVSASESAPARYRSSVHRYRCSPCSHPTTRTTAGQRNPRARRTRSSPSQARRPAPSAETAPSAEAALFPRPTSLVPEVELDAPVLRVAGLGVLSAVAAPGGQRRGADALPGDSVLDERVGDRGDALIAQLLVALVGSSRVGIAREPELELRVLL